MKNLLTLTLILVLSVGFFTNCKKNNGDPPVLPPTESMSIDFSNFSSTTKSVDFLSSQKGTNNSNWVFATTVVGYWKLVLTTTLAVPVNAFKLAADQTPVYLGSKTWQWSYSVTVLGSTYKTRLTGQIRTTDVLWNMFVTKEGTGAFPEFLWIDGTSKLDGTSGQWVIKQNPDAPVAMLQIDWTKSGTSIGSITCTSLKNDTYLNNYIKFGKTTGTYDAYFEISFTNIRGTFTVYIEWNTTSKIGRMKCSDYLGDPNAWYTWDGNYTNN